MFMPNELCGTDCVFVAGRQKHRQPSKQWLHFMSFIQRRYKNLKQSGYGENFSLGNWL